MEIHLTERAAAEYERISSGAMTPEMASEYLRDGRIQLRTFAESLREVYPFPDIGRRLTDAFLAFEPESSPEAVAKKAGAKALITGESLGQVASQTMMALGVTEDVTTMPVLRPLIGMDKVEIIRFAREIGTFDTSILPYEDCCTVFTPRHPATRPDLEAVRAAEAVLDVDGLVAKAMAGETWVRVKVTDEAKI